MSFLVDTETLILSGLSAATELYGDKLRDFFRPLFVTGFSIWILLISYEVAFGKTEDGLSYILVQTDEAFPK